MADRELELDLLANDRATPAIKRVGDAIDDLGDEMRDAAKDAESLDRETKAIQSTLKELAQAFASTGDAAKRMELSKAMRAEQSKLRQIMKVASFLPSPAEMAEGAAVLGKSAASSMSLAMGRGMSSSGAGGAAILAGVSTLTALIGPLIGAAVLGGAGTAGIVGGVVAASSDSRVKSAFGELTDVASRAWKHVGATFAPAVIPEIQKVSRAIDLLLRGDLGAAIGDAAKLIGPLTDGIIGMVQKMMPGIREAISAAGPIFDVLARELPELGEKFGNLFRTAADNAPQAAAALTMLLDAIGVLVDIIGTAISFGSGLFEVLINIGIVAADALILLMEIGSFGSYDSNTHWIGDMRKGLVSLRDGMNETVPAVHSTVASFRTMNISASALSGSLGEIVSSLKEILGVNMSAREASRQMEAAIDDATEAFKKNGKTIDDNTAKGRANNAAIDSLISSSNEQMEANAKQGATLQELTGTYNSNRATIMKTAIQMGYTKEAAQQLTNKLLATPKLVHTDAELESAEALRKIREFNSKLNSIDQYIPVTVHTTYSSSGNARQQAPFREMGGPVRKGEAYIVGEKRAEVFVPDRDGTIIPSMEEAAGKGYGGRLGGGSSAKSSSGGGMNLTINSGGADLDDLLVRVLARAVRDRGGDVQVVLGRR